MARNGEEPWRPAVEAGDVELLRQVIRQYGTDVLKVGTWNGTTPLRIAILRNHVAIIHFLVEDCGPVARLKWQNGGKDHDALEMAAEAKNLALVQYLVEKGFTVEDEHLSIATASGDQARVNFMMETRLAAEVKRRDECTAKMVKAVAQASQQLVDKRRELAAHVGGADAKMEKFMQAPLFAACRTGPLSMVQYLVETRQFNVESTDEREQTPLFKACSFGHLEVVRYLVEKCHASVECLDEDNKTPLFLACESGHLEIVEYLVEKYHAKVDVQSRYGGGPLYKAMFYGRFNVVRYLVETCGSMDCNSTFHSACDGSGSLDMVRYFLQHAKVDVDWTNKHGETALHQACARAKWNMVQLLVVDGKANVSATCNNGRNALHQVRRSGYNPLTVNECDKIIHCLLSSGNRINVNARDCSGKTALHYGCARFSLETARMLLECGQARVDIADADGETCLHLAARWGARSFRTLYLFVHHLSADFGTGQVSAFDYTSVSNAKVCSSKRPKTQE